MDYGSSRERETKGPPRERDNRALRTVSVPRLTERLCRAEKEVAESQHVRSVRTSMMVRHVRAALLFSWFSPPSLPLSLCACSLRFAVDEIGGHFSPSVRPSVLRASHLEEGKECSRRTSGPKNKSDRRLFPSGRPVTFRKTFKSHFFPSLP